MQASAEGRPTSDRHVTMNREVNVTAGQEFIPHIFDLIILAQKAEKAKAPSAITIPEIYLQSYAVDTAKILGYGASFIVSVHKLPEAAPIAGLTVDMDGLQVTPKKFVSSPSHIVYKVARVEFQENGEPIPNHRRAFSSVLTELRALTHPPLLHHPNIVDFLDLAWGGNPFNHRHKLPILVVEYADHGTLKDLQNRQVLSSEFRRTLCLDVAQGLDALHRCGIIHGDMKAENVLIFSHPQKTFIAKLADFGFSLVENADSEMVLLSGTWPWKAPEFGHRIPKDHLKQTDVYSFGLLIWSIAIDGENPFDLIISQNVNMASEIQRLKTTDGLLSLSKLSIWYPKWYVSSSRLAKRRPNSPVPSLQELQEMIKTQRVDLISDEESFQDLDRILTTGLLLGLPGLKNKLIAMSWMGIKADRFYGSLDTIFENSLSCDVGRRNLAAIVGALEISSEESGFLPMGVSSTLASSREYQFASDKKHLISWQKMRYLEPAVQRFVFNASHSMAYYRENGSDGNPFHLLAVGAFYINGYGTDVDPSKGLNAIARSALFQSGSDVARAYLYRLFRAHGKEPGSEVPITDYLSVAALKGSRTALDDLETVSIKEFAFAKEALHASFAGMGANFYHGINMLHGLTYHWLRVLKNFIYVLEGQNDIYTFSVNKRGDRLLHFAASCGLYEAVSALIETYNINIDQVNSQGETALLCACRAGHAEIARLLLRNHASPSIGTPNGETPLHWLISFDNRDVEDLANLLIQNSPDATSRETTERIYYSVFPGGIDNDHLSPGTPLHWAVHHDRPEIVKQLLSYGASAWKEVHHISPIGLAAYMHHPECLGLMLEKLENDDIVFSYNGLISLAIRADRFSMMLTHGHLYKGRIEATLNLLWSKCGNISFSTGIGGFGQSALFTSVSTANDDVVDYLLNTEEGLKDINKPRTLDGRTPLLECVRWNRKQLFEVLIKHGANIFAKERNPFTALDDSWTALHLIAHAGDLDHVSLVNDIVRLGVRVEGRSIDDVETETPLMTAIQNQSFNLATSLLKLGADINALSLSCGFLFAEHPMTVLGYVICTNSRYAIQSLRYLLQQHWDQSGPKFVVEPLRDLTALHRAAWAHCNLGFSKFGPIKFEDFDQEINRDILSYLLQKYNSPAHFNVQSQSSGRTALHYAVEACNRGAVEELIRVGADAAITDAAEEIPLHLAQRLASQLDNKPEMLAEMERIIQLLQ